MAAFKTTIEIHPHDDALCGRCVRKHLIEDDVLCFAFLNSRNRPTKLKRTRTVARLVKRCLACVEAEQDDATEEIQQTEEQEMLAHFAEVKGMQPRCRCPWCG